ncbi:immune inhibitor A domain-containing protein [Promethearchaeum syntrophicum]|uniref:Immune inhibitor A domain-containing protein n=1 Tax=Promethearchaeum syntrophicum TaxID=2594042 RepID=A0A5B9DG90_9ARCH|nr:immune inhibitor A domain-containing protein [Candidatus Prometheoarchaeum syntrophicum]
MKKKTTISVFILSVFVISGLTSIISVTAQDYVDPTPIDIGWKLRNDGPLKYAEKYMEKEGIALDISGYPTYPEVGAIKYWLVLDENAAAGYVWSYYILRASGNMSEIWVQLELDFDGKKGDHRDTPIVEDWQVDYLLDEFENNIYPIDTGYFGNEDFHNGSKAILSTTGEYFEESGKSVILVSNIRDTNYYDHDYPYYYAGFYSPSLENYFDRNIISIDCYDWVNRVGDDAKRPNLYEGVIAHEYQHLIHDDLNTYDDIFMNEGCSMYAEPLCGYPLAEGDINSYMATPDNSLVDWEDQGGTNILADYGSALLWAIYLGDTYGETFIRDFVQSGIGGIPGINAVLESIGSEDRFEDAFHNWRIANLIHSGDYNYLYMDLADFDSARVYNLDATTAFPYKGSDFGQTVSILGYETDVYLLGDYSTDYIALNGLNYKTLSFNGDDLATVPHWENDGNTLYSTPAAPEMDLRILYDLDLTGITEPKLTFDTEYEIEDLWDFGFVQISNDDGNTWTSLENEYTNDEYDPAAYPAIIDNLPGLCGSFDGTMTFDLGAFIDQEVILQFRYMTDWATEEAGWWVENVKVNDIPLNMEAFYSIIPEADFMVTLTTEDGSILQDLDLNDLNEGTWDLTSFGDENILLIVSATVGMADYELNFF